MKDEFKRILNLVRKTGDRMIVTDTDGQNAYVVMDLDQYERLLDDSFNKLEEIKDNHENEMELNDYSWPQPISDVLKSESKLSPDIWNTMKVAGSEAETWDLSKMSENDVADLEKQYQKYAQEAVSSVVVPTESESEKTVFPPKLAEFEEDFGEEQFYLEPIE